MEFKICTQCKRELPATTEYFNRCSKVKSGLYSKCKDCRKLNAMNNKEHIQEYQRNYYKANKTRINEINKRNYEINKDRILKHNKEYRQINKEYIEQCRKKYMELNREKFKEYWKMYYQNNKEEISVKQKEYYLKNKERKSEYHKYWRINNLDRLRDYGKKYRNDNSVRLREYRLKNIERIRNVQKEYFKNNPEVKRMSEHKRNALKRALPNTLTLNQWNEIKKCFNNKCAYCNSEESLTQDHFIPLSKGGGYTRNNIIPACKSCNSSKGNRDFFEWYKKQMFYNLESEEKIINHLRAERHYLIKVYSEPK